MKKSIAIFFLAIALISCKEEGKPQTNSLLPVMSFDKHEFDFGTIQKDEIVEHVFQFTNTGGTNLVISNAAGSCGCTIPDYPKEPIVSGETGQIKVKFNPAGKSGRQTKTVSIGANTAKGTETLTIKANITAG